MKFLGFEINRAREESLSIVQRYFSPVWSGGSSLWRNLVTSISEPFMGAWQQNAPVVNRQTSLAFSAVFSCVTGISSDIAKNRIKISRDDDGIWNEIKENNPWLLVLREPNHYQTTQQFLESWMLSKLVHGNTYIVKERDERGIVNAMYVLDATGVIPLVADNGDVFYDIRQDNLSHIREQIVAPASEIIHDRFNTFFHPLVGLSPLYACALNMPLGSAALANAQAFFANRSMPGGILTAPGRIDDETAARLKTTFEEKFSGTNMGRLFVAGNGLDFKQLTMTAEQAELIELLKFSATDVGRAFHYPEHKLGGPMPPYSTNPQALTLYYYTDCLHPLIEAVEGCLDRGLELPLKMGTEVDIENLLRMDTNSLYESNSKGVGGGWLGIDEARFRANYKPTDGGNTPYLQQQNYSLAALAKRDQQADPFAKNTPAAEPQPPKLQVVRDSDISTGALALACKQREMALLHE